MDHNGEVGMKKEEETPTVGEFVLWKPLLVIQKVHVEIEGNVFDKEEEVSDGNASENHVNWIRTHVFVHEDKNVDRVRYDAKNTNDQSNPSMKW